MGQPATLVIDIETVGQDPELISARAREILFDAQTEELFQGFRLQLHQHLCEILPLIFLHELLSVLILHQKNLRCSQ